MILLTGCIGTRHIVTFMLFLGMANAYVMRTNMSVAIVAMVNHTALPKDHTVTDDECDAVNSSASWVAEMSGSHQRTSERGTYVWDAQIQSYVLSSFFYGYVITQIPFGILAKKYGAKYFLGVGMLINSVFGLLVPLGAEGGLGWLLTVRFIQGLGEASCFSSLFSGPIVPCTHAMLAKWIPPNERSRMGAFIYAGAQFGTVVSYPLSGLLAEYGFSGGWPSIFYVFGIVGAIWSVAFLFMVAEDPDSSRTIAEDERKYITNSLWGAAGISNGILSALPYLAMWLFSMLVSHIADWMISSHRFSHTITRKLVNSIGHFGPAIALVAASYTGCNPPLTVALLTIGVGLNGGIYSGFKVNHLDISPRFAGILMSFTNCLANLAGLLAPLTAGFVTEGRPTQAAWRVVFFIASGVYLFCGTFYAVFSTGVRQQWDNPDNDASQTNGKHKYDIERDGVMLQNTNLNH
ncbi:putative inorganic phosphate cotransporter [Blattella germanica]|nr:putative inorganic phosphate cotransporter [Blattella germanica]